MVVNTRTTDVVYIRITDSDLLFFLLYIFVETFQEFHKNVLRFSSKIHLNLEFSVNNAVLFALPAAQFLVYRCITKIFVAVNISTF